MLWCHILFLNNVRKNDFIRNTRFTAARSDLEFPNEGNPTFAKIPIPPKKNVLHIRSTDFVNGKRSRNKTRFFIILVSRWVISGGSGIFPRGVYFAIFLPKTA